MKTAVILGLAMLIALAACNGVEQQQNGTEADDVQDLDDVANDTSEGADTTEENSSNGDDNGAADDKEDTPMGSVVAVLKVSNADAVEGIETIDFRISKVLLEAADGGFGKYHSVASSTVTTDLISLGDGMIELGLNNVRAQTYKLIEFRVKDDGEATTENGATTYSVPFENLQIVKPIELAKNEIITIILDIDLGASVEKIDETIVVRPKITTTVLKDADVTRKGEGRVEVEGGEELFSITKEFNDMIPDKDKAKMKEDCEESCEDSCTAVDSSCRDDCVSAVTTGCALGGDDCREKCDPFIVRTSPAACRDNCEDESESTCKKNLVDLCGTACQKSSDSDACTTQCKASC